MTATRAFLEFGGRCPQPRTDERKRSTCATSSTWRPAATRRSAARPRRRQGTPATTRSSCRRPPTSPCRCVRRGQSATHRARRFARHPGAARLQQACDDPTRRGSRRRTQRKPQAACTTSRHGHRRGALTLEEVTLDLERGGLAMTGDEPRDLQRGGSVHGMGLTTARGRITLERRG